MATYLVLILIGVLSILAVAKWTVSFLRRRLAAPIVLYQFQDSSYSRRTKQAWHVIGDAKSIDMFVSRVAYIRVSWMSSDDREYIGTYKKRLVSSFRRTLRQRGAKLEIRYEMPGFLRTDSKEYHSVGRGYGFK